MSQEQQEINQQDQNVEANPTAQPVEQSANENPIEKPVLSNEATQSQLESKLNEAVQFSKQKNFDAAENIFSDLMIQAIKLYKTETHPDMAKYFFFYGDMLLSKLENNPDVFGNEAKKKIDKVDGKTESSNAADNAQSTEIEQTQNNDATQEQEEEEEENEEGVEENRCEVEEIVQLDTVVFKDENVEIRDETQNPEGEEGGEEETEDKTVIENNNNNSNGNKDGKISLDPVDPIDDLQLAWEHLELSRKIYQEHLEKVQASSDENKKENGVSIIKQIIEITLRIGDLESWKDNLSEAVKEYSKALELSKEIEDQEFSRNLSSVYFQLGNALLYENKDFCEDLALQYYVESAQIMENCLSQKILTPPKEIPSFKTLKKEDLQVFHLKHSFLDDEESKQIKDTLKNLYERIEDTVIQRDERDKYKQYQEQMKKQSLNQNQFAAPTLVGAPIKNLGLLGIKRKEPQPDPPKETGGEGQIEEKSEKTDSSDKKLKKD